MLNIFYIKIAESFNHKNKLVLQNEKIKNKKMKGSDRCTRTKRTPDQTVLITGRTDSKTVNFLRITLMASVTLVAQNEPIPSAFFAYPGLRRRQSLYQLLQLSRLVQLHHLVRTANISPANKDSRQG